MNRRKFIQTIYSGGIALPLLSNDLIYAVTENPVKKDKKMIPIIDTHQHLWDLSQLKLSWITNEPSPLHHSFTPKEYAEATKGLPIAKSVYMEVDVVPADQQKETDYIIELIKSKKTPMVAAVVAAHPLAANFKDHVNQFKGSPFIKGIRQVIHVDSTPAKYCLKKDFIKGVQYLGEIGLSFDICIRPAELTDAAKLVDECPNTRFILDHCGNGQVTFKPDQFKDWQKSMEILASKKNLVSKVSGIVASAEKGKWKPADLAPLVNHTIKCFGWDRVMFGGDWPVCTRAATYREWVEALQEIVKNESTENQKKLFYDNANKFYGLE